MSNTDYRTFPTARSRTPMLLPNDSLSRVTSSDVDTETDLPPLSHRGAPPQANARNQRSENMRSQMKLTKMGIPVSNQTAATASRTAVSPPTPPSSGSKRFVGRIIQSFKGKA